MIIPCYRCGSKIDTPDDSNSDYIIAEDLIVEEQREVFIALKQNRTTLAKRAKLIKDNTITTDNEEKVPPTDDFIRNQFQDNEYDAVEVSDVATAQKLFGEDLIKVVVEMRNKDIQKTGIICPDCHLDTDLIIWGIHKDK